MLQDGLTLTDTTVATNFSIQNGTSLPSSGNNVGELFYLTAGNAGLYIYTGTEWIPSTAASEVSFDSLNVKPAVRAMSVINVPAPAGTLTVDGVSLSIGDRVLLTGQASAVNNGVWVVASGSWTRATDFDGSPSNEVKAGDFVFVTEGTTYADTGWVLTTDGTITVGTTPLTFAQFTGGSGTAALSTSYIGFGSATNELTGSANLTWVDGTRTLSIGTTGTASTVTTVGTGSLTIKGGQGSGTATGGAITVQAGSSQTEGGGGSNQGPALTLKAGSGGGAVGPGGDLVLQTTPDFAANYVSRLTIKANGSWILNGFAGNVGQALMSNGSSAPPSWQSVAVTGGGSSTIQYNSSGSLAGSSDFTFNGGQIVDLGNFTNDGNAVLRVHGLITSGTDGGNSTGLTIRTANRSGQASGLTIGVGTSSGNNPGASITITAGAEGANGYGGGNVAITGGSGYNGVNGYAGSVVVAGGVGSASQGAVVLRTAGINRFTVNGDGSLGIGAGNSVGSAGQVLTSNGAAAPSWQTPAGGGSTFTTFTGTNTSSVNTITTSASTTPPTTSLFITVGDNSAGTPGLLLLQGGTSTATSGTGAAVQLRGGTGGGGGSTTGGQVIIRGGLGTGSGGAIVFTTAPTTTDTERFRILANGAWSVGSAGTNTGTSGQVLVSTGSTTPPSWQNVSSLIGWYETANTTFAASLTINCAAVNAYRATLTANTTSFAFSNVPASGFVYTVTLFLTQDGTGGRLMTWPTGTKWAGGSIPVLTTTAGKTDIFTLTTPDGGTTWYGTVVGQNF